MNASKTSDPEGQSARLLRVVIGTACLAAILAVVWTLRTRSWQLTLAYALLLLAGAFGVLRGSRKRTSEREIPTRRDERVIAISVLAAALVQFSLKFYLHFSWLWSIVIALVVLVVIVVVEGLLRRAGASVLKDPTWLFGNLPPIELMNRDRAGEQPSGRLAGSMPRLALDNQMVDINRQTFSLGDRFAADKLALANFEQCSSVALVRASALPNQVVLSAKRCVVRSFGGEFTVATLMKENTPPSMMIVSTAFLYYAKGNLLEPLRLERIAVVVAGSEYMVGTITQRFAKLTSEMVGDSRLGSRGQRIWDAGDLFLVLGDETWKDVHRATITWTSENLDVGGAR